MSYRPHLGLRVLVISDDRLVQHHLADSLNIIGMQASWEADPYRALWLLQKEPFDLVIAEIDMPAMDGDTLRRQIHQGNVAPPPVIALTSSSRLIEGNFASVLRRPYQFRGLWQAIESALPSRQIRPFLQQEQKTARLVKNE